MAKTETHETTMSPSQPAPEKARRRALFTRSSRDHVIGGVAGGFGERFGIDPMIVRLALVPLSMAGGGGVILYLAAWLVSDEPDARAPATKPPASTIQQTLAIGCIVLGALLLLRSLGLWFGDAWVWPVALAVFGSTLIWTRGESDVRERWTRLARRLPGIPARVLASGASPARILGGGALIAAGMGVLLAVNDALPELRNLLFAVAVTLAGGALIFGPGVLRLIRQLSEERRERIRSEERAEMAAHLHDSVLQTLALLQRTESRQEIARLARVQERELRSWLYGKSATDGQDHLSGALDTLARRIESTHDVTVEAVLVGDCPLDERVHSLVLACGEAVMNAVKHSGSREVSVYVEVEPDAVVAYVRDQGSGFDPQHVPGDRRGIAESIVGRMERWGGSAVVASAPGRGTEVQLHLPGSVR